MTILPFPLSKSFALVASRPSTLPAFVYAPAIATRRVRLIVSSQTPMLSLLTGKGCSSGTCGSCSRSPPPVWRPLDPVTASKPWIRPEAISAAASRDVAAPSRGEQAHDDVPIERGAREAVSMGRGAG